LTGRLLRFSPRSTSSEEGLESARALLAASIPERGADAATRRLEDPEILLSVCELLRQRMDTSPLIVREEGEYFYRFLSRPKRAIGLFDEREYFLGEMALIAGTACRQLSRRDEARLWFDRAESGFRHTANALCELSRLAYQRLALRLEERQLDAVLEMAPPLVETFEDLRMPEEALKSRFLVGLALMECDRLPESVQVFEEICRDAVTLKSEKLLASAYANLTTAYGMMGDSTNAIEASRRAIPILKRMDDRIALAKVRWGLATLLRETGQIHSSIEAHKTAQGDFEAIGMRADAAALRLVVADLLIEVGREREAIREILSALPVIDELKMVPEGMAALSLLRESVRQERVNRQALRDLHGYFEDLNSPTG
jgi:tetratricopeptide (TPR) repeat protein